MWRHVIFSIDISPQQPTQYRFCE